MEDFTVQDIETDGKIDILNKVVVLLENEQVSQSNGQNDNRVENAVVKDCIDHKEVEKNVLDSETINHRTYNHCLERD